MSAEERAAALLAETAGLLGETGDARPAGEGGDEDDDAAGFRDRETTHEEDGGEDEDREEVDGEQVDGEQQGEEHRRQDDLEKGAREENRGEEKRQGEAVNTEDDERGDRPHSPEGDADALLAQTAALLAGSEDDEEGDAEEGFAPSARSSSRPKAAGVSLASSSSSSSSSSASRSALASAISPSARDSASASLAQMDAKVLDPGTRGSLTSSQNSTDARDRDAGPQLATNRSVRTDSTMSEEMNGADLLAETEALLAGRPPTETEGAGLAREAVKQAVREELSRIRKRLANDVTLVCCGSGVRLRDLFLLDACIFVPLRVDLSNQEALTQVAGALTDHDYEVRARDEGQLRASYVPTPEELRRLSSSMTMTRSSPPGSPRAEPAAAHASLSSSSGSASTASSSPSSSRVGQAEQLEAPNLGDEPREFVSKAMTFSLSKLQRALQHVDALQLKAAPAGASRRLQGAHSQHADNDAGKTASMAAEPYASAAVGVEVESKQRGIFICGAEHETEPLLTSLIQRGVTRLPSGVACLHADYVSDLEEAWRLGAERKLHEMVRPREREIQPLEYQTAQLVTLIKAEYRAFGVQIPELERPPHVSQLPLTYEPEPSRDDGAGGDSGGTAGGGGGNADVDSDAEADDVRSGAETEDIALRSKLSRHWSREVAARAARKDRQLEIRREICARNKTLLVQRLRDSEVARTSRDTLVLCNEMEIPPSVVLGHVSCIFERRPGRLSVTFDHILFASRVLGFKRSLAVPLTDISAYSGEQTTGATTIVGAAALKIRVLSTGASMRFLLSAKMDCDRILALLQQIEAMRRALAASRQRRASRESKTSDSEVQRTSSGESRASRRRSDESPAPAGGALSAMPVQGEARGSRDEGDVKGSIEGKGAQIDVAGSSKRDADLQKMMASTFLNDDEEAF